MKGKVRQDFTGTYRLGFTYVGTKSVHLDQNDKDFRNVCMVGYKGSEQIKYPEIFSPL